MVSDLRSRLLSPCEDQFVTDRVRIDFAEFTTYYHRKTVAESGNARNNQSSVDNEDIMSRFCLPLEMILLMCSYTPLRSVDALINIPRQFLRLSADGAIVRVSRNGIGFGEDGDHKLPTFGPQEPAED